MIVHASPFSINHSIVHQSGIGNIHYLGVFADDIPAIFNVTLQVMKEIIDCILDGLVFEQEKKEVFKLTNLAIYAHAIFKDEPIRLEDIEK